MSKLYDALKTLEPIEYSDVPLDHLDTFLKGILSQAELAINSVPSPAGGDDFLSSSLSHSDSNVAHSSAEMTLSSARPPPRKVSNADLQKQWGKPIKLNAKDNPLGMTMYKMAGNDRHGAWFARSSVHEGIGFSKFKKALLREFPETLKVEGGPGAGSIRGIGGDRRLERKVVDGVGTLEVYQLSAQFPGPTTPREFIALFMTSDNALSDESMPDPKPKIPQVIPRHLMIVSKPVAHPEAQPREGYVLGKYESIEFIREIPITLVRSSSSSNLLNQTNSPDQKRMSLGRKRSSTIGFAESRGPDAKGERRDRGRSPNTQDPELNPVEWLMITRSDPGGGIPRFMVERGTPASIVADAAKFLDWACSKDESWFDEQKAADETGNGNASATSPSKDASEKRPEREDTANVQMRDSQQEDSFRDDQSDSDTSSSDTSSAESFISARQFGNIPAERRRYSSSSSSSRSSAKRIQVEQERPRQQYPYQQQQKHIPTLLLPQQSSSASPQRLPEDKLNRTLAKLEQDRSAIDARLERIRERESTRMRDTTTKTQDEREQARARERADKEIRKHEERHAREISKLEDKRHKAIRKAELRLRKAETKDSLACAQHERDAARAQVDALRRENGLLKIQVGELQKENTALVARLGKSEEGQRVLRMVREESSASGSASDFAARVPAPAASGSGGTRDVTVGSGARVAGNEAGSLGGGRGRAGVASENASTRSRASSLRSEASAAASGILKRATFGAGASNHDNGHGSSGNDINNNNNHGSSSSGSGNVSGSGILNHIKSAATAAASPLSSSSISGDKKSEK